MLCAGRFCVRTCDTVVLRQDSSHHAAQQNTRAFQSVPDRIFQICCASTSAQLKLALLRPLRTLAVYAVLVDKMVTAKQGEAWTGH